MRGLQGVGYRNDNAADVSTGGAAHLDDPFLSIAAMNVFQHDEGGSIELNEIMDVDNVFMGDLAEQLRLAPVPVEKTRLMDEEVRQHLDRELVGSVDGPKHPAHVAGSQLLDNFIRANPACEDIGTGPVEPVGYEMR